MNAGFWLAVGVIGLLTYGIRLSFILVAGRGEMPLALQRALRFVPVTVLTAIFVPAMLLPDGTTLDLFPTNARLVAGIVAILVAWRTKQVILCIIAGMGTLWLVQFVVHFGA
jgi:branched-subunit amino acid transport protein